MSRTSLFHKVSSLQSNRTNNQSLQDYRWKSRQIRTCISTSLSYSLKSLTPLKPTSMHVSTPLFNRISPQQSNPSLPCVKPASEHIPTPVPQHKLSSTPPTSPKRPYNVYSISPERRKRPAQRMTRQCGTAILTFRYCVVQTQFSEASLHTPPKRRHYVDVGLARLIDLQNSVGQYTVRSHSYKEEEKHIHWADKAFILRRWLIDRTQRPLVQGTPPPSQPLHRQIKELKPCMDSPDASTKQSLEEQRMAMITSQRTAYLEQLERKKARLF